MTALTHTNVTFQTEDKEIYKTAISCESARVHQLAEVLESCGVNSVTSYFDNFPAAEYVPDAEWNPTWMLLPKALTIPPAESPLFKEMTVTWRN